MKKTIEYSCYSELPYILKIFLEDVDTKMIKNDFIKIENKLLKIYDDDIIPDEIKNKINFNK
jgi:predicted RNA methylase